MVRVAAVVVVIATIVAAVVTVAAGQMYVLDTNCGGGDISADGYRDVTLTTAPKYANGIDCRVVITAPSANHTVSLLFAWLSISASDNVTLFDGNFSEPMMATLSGDTVTTAAYTTTGPVLSIRVLSAVSGSTGRGFLATVTPTTPVYMVDYCTSQIAVDANVTLSVTRDATYGRALCGVLLVGTPTITLALSRVSLDPQGLDSLQIYDYSTPASQYLIATVRSNAPPTWTVTSSGSVMYLQFQSTSDHRYRGFDALLSTGQQCGGTTNVTTGNAVSVFYGPCRSARRRALACGLALQG